MYWFARLTCWHRNLQIVQWSCRLHCVLFVLHSKVFSNLGVWILMFARIPRISCRLPSLVIMCIAIKRYHAGNAVKLTFCHLGQVIEAKNTCLWGRFVCLLATPFHICCTPCYIVKQTSSTVLHMEQLCSDVETFVVLTFISAASYIWMCVYLGDWCSCTSI